MAIQTRLYVLKGPTQNEIDQFIDPSVQVIERFRTPVAVLEYDDAIPGLLDTMDVYMDQQWGLDAGKANQKVPGYVYGMTCSYVSATTVQIGTGQCKAKNDKDNLVLAASTNVDITVAGIGGLDTGIEQASNWYFIYVIGDSTGVNPTAGILSASDNNPTFPVGYDIARRVGSVRNQSGDFRNFQQFGLESDRSVQYRDAISERQRLTGGAATVVTAISCSNLVPPTSAMASLQIQQRGTVTASLYDDPTQVLADAQRTVLTGGSLYDDLRVSAGRDLAYANAAAGGLLDVWVTGYQESI
jgi:hypothetical protein